MSGKSALIIANTEYIDPGLAQLTAPGKDAEDFARVLKDTNLCAFDDVKVLLNQLSSSVIEGIDEFFDQRKPDDLLVVYFSGHGVRDEFGTLFLAVRNTIRTRLRSTAIRSDYIREAMDQSRSKRQVLILDCCNSGAFPQGTKAETGGRMGLTQAFQGYGRFVLTASDATQFAWEGSKVIGETDNSLFTHFLVTGLEGAADRDGDGKITVDELYDYAFDQVSRVTPKQTPTKSAAKVEGEIVLRRFTRLEDIKPIALPEDLISEIEDLRPYVREAAVQKLEKIVKGKNIGLARSALEALQKIASDDNTTRRVAQIAAQVLETARQAQQQAEETEEKRLASEKLDAERKATEEAEKILRAQAKREATELAARQAAERDAKEKAEKEATQKAARETAELAAHKEAEQEAKEARFQGKTKNPQSVLQQPVLKWAMIGVIGLFVLGAGVWGMSYLASSGLGSPTEGPNTSVPSAEIPNSGAASTATSPAGALAPSEKIQVRWFVGLGTGVSDQQIPVEEEVVADFNASHDNIELVLEVVTFSDDPEATFSDQIASGNGPDIIGPVGLDGANAFQDQWLDLAPYLSETSFSLVSDPALQTFFQSEVGQLGLPVGVYPAAVYYVPSVFDEAGLNYPPNKYGEDYVMPDGAMVEWNWDTLTQIARLLTLDANGRNASDGDFDRNHIVQLGFDFQWQTNIIYMASYRAGAARIVQNNSSTLPESWKKAMRWYYDGMWGDQPFIANGTLASSPDIDARNLFNSGKVAMAVVPIWYACCHEFLGTSFEFQFAALPKGDDGKVHGRVDVDTFRIWEGTQHPKEAFEVLSYLLTTGAEKLLPAYGAIPALPSQRDAVLAKKYVDYPFVTQKSWLVYLQGLAYPDIPSADQYQPNGKEARQREEEFFYLLQSTPPSDLDFDTEWQRMIDELNVIYNK
jgi:multiple sugar transport system substrate-binding protein